jgi:CPA2 family monovalent cation:H+ antiporter-2
VLLAAGVGQIGEFSFILVELAGRLEILPQRAHDLVLGGAILSILLNPVAFFVAEQFRPRFKDVGEPPVAVPTDATAVSLDDDEEVMPGEPMQREPIPRTALEGHVVVVGGGVVGSFVAEELKSAVRPFLLIEESDTLTERQRREGVEVLFGNAADSEVLEAANLEQARQLVVTIPQAFEAGQVVRQARTANPDLEIVARAYSDAEATYLTDMGANMVVMGTYEVAKAIVKQLSDSAAVNMQEEMEDFGAYI